MRMKLIEVILGVATLIGGIAAIGYFVDKYKNPENKTIEQKLERVSKEILPKNILEHIQLGTSLEYVKQLLSNPNSVDDSISSAYNFNKEIKTTVWNYTFSNAALTLEADNGKTISVITLQAYDGIFELPVVGNMDDLTMGQIFEESNKSEKDLFLLTSMRDGYILLETYFGRMGEYKTYTFGSINIMVDEKIENKIYDRGGNLISIRDDQIDFISISEDEGRGHPIYEVF